MPIWINIVKYYLSNLNIDIDIIFKIGHKDILIISQKLLPQTTFWSETFKNMSEIISLIERSNEHILNLPAFGGEFSKKVDNATLSIFGPHSKSIRSLIRSGYYLITHFITDNTSFPDLKNCLKYKSLSLLNETTGPDISVIGYTSLLSSLTKMFHVILKKEGLYLNLEFTPNMKTSCIRSFFSKNSKGSSKLYKMIMQEHIDINKIPIAPAYRTAQRDYNITMDLRKWESNLAYSPKIIALGGSSAFFYKVQIRQNWTRVKNSKTYRDEELALCLNCKFINDEELESDSKHAFYDCQIAKRLFKILSNISIVALEHIFDHSPQNIIFLQGSLPSDKDAKKVLIDLHICTLHTLQKISLSETLLNDIAIERIFYKNLITTVYANKSINRCEQIYNQVLDAIYMSFKTIGLMNLYMRTQ